jgi:hypothetical protein
VPGILVAGLILTVVWAGLLVKTEHHRFRTALVLALREFTVPILGFFAVSLLPSEYWVPAIAAALVTAFLVQVVRGYVQAGQEKPS